MKDLTAEEIVDSITTLRDYHNVRLTGVDLIKRYAQQEAKRYIKEDRDRIVKKLKMLFIPGIDDIEKFISKIRKPNIYG